RDVLALPAGASGVLAGERRGPRHPRRLPQRPGGAPLPLLLDYARGGAGRQRALLGRAALLGGLHRPRRWLELPLRALPRRLPRPLPHADAAHLHGGGAGLPRGEPDPAAGGPLSCGAPRGAAQRALPAALGSAPGRLRRGGATVAGPAQPSPSP